MVPSGARRNFFSNWHWNAKNVCSPEIIHDKESLKYCDFFQENLITISTSNNKVQNWNICQSFKILIIESNKDKVHHVKISYCDASKKWAQSTVYTVNIKKAKETGHRKPEKLFCEPYCRCTRFFAERREAKIFKTITSK